MTEQTPAPVLSPAERRALKARAHALEPVVRVGDKGLTPAVLAEIDRALAAHELIKVRVQAERGDRTGILDEICARSNASAVQHIGKMLVVYRPRPPEAAKAEDREKVRKEAARKAKARKAPDRKKVREPDRKPGHKTFGKPGARRAGPRPDGRAPRGTGRPGSRTASPRRAPERPLRRPRTSR
jgi:RNA-binding protein